MVDSMVILGVVVINAIIGFVQEGKAEKAVDAIRNILTQDAVVVRDGKKVSVEAREIVPGDVVFLQPGDKVPADLRLFDNRDLRIEEAPLTGESVPTDKIIGVVAEKATLGGCPRMPFFPNSSLFAKNNARNINYMSVLIFRKRLDLRKNIYSRTAS